MKKLFSEQALAKCSPSGEILAFHKGKINYKQSWGKKYRYYDLSSLTKILFTNELIIGAQQNKILNVNDAVTKYLPYWHKSVSIKNLLRHDSGYTWWKPFYKMIPQSLDKELRLAYLQNLILKEKRKMSGKAVYSDIDYFILGFVLEHIYTAPLIVLLDLLESPFHFNVDKSLKFAKELYAPTAICPWRKRRLQGEVHDPNAWALSGVAPHAGLFGGTKEMTTWFLSFRKKWLKNTTYKVFTKRAIAKAKGDWALGYMLPTKGSASCGDYFSPESFGHTGFTGTSFWYDPKKDFAVIILSNRLYYGESNQEHKKLRPLAHNTLYKEFIK